jgi:hypothetical protein
MDFDPSRPKTYICSRLRDVMSVTIEYLGNNIGIECEDSAKKFADRATEPDG